MLNPSWTLPALLLTGHAYAGPTFVADNPADAAIAQIAWEAGAECTGRPGQSHATVTISRTSLRGGLLGMAHWDADGLYQIDLDAKPGRLEEVIVHEVSHAWVMEGPPTLVEGRTELLADCMVARRMGLASMQWDDGRNLNNLPDLKTWDNKTDHGPAVLADVRTDAYLGAARLMRSAALLVDPKTLWQREAMTWDSFQALIASAENGPDLLRALDGSVVDQQLALGDPDLDGIPSMAEKWLGSDPQRWDTDGDGWWDGELLGLPHMAIAVPFDGSPVCTGLTAPKGHAATAAVGGNLRGHGTPEVYIRQTRPNAPILLESRGIRERVTGGLWAVVEGSHLVRSDGGCTDTQHGTIWAAESEFHSAIPDFAMALHAATVRAHNRWGPTTRRMGIALGAEQTQMDGQVIHLSSSDVRQAIQADRLDALANLAVSLHRVWDNGTRQWNVAAAMARSLDNDPPKAPSRTPAPNDATPSRLGQ